MKNNALMRMEIMRGTVDGGSDTWALENTPSNALTGVQKLQMAIEGLKWLRQTKKDTPFDHDETSTLKIMTGLATCYTLLGCRTEAWPLYETVLESIRSQLGSEHPKTLLAMVTVANAYESSGKLWEARALHEQAVNLSRREFGEAHPLTIRAIGNLADTYLYLDCLDIAVELSEQLMSIARTKLDDESPPHSLHYQSAGELLS
ncbi:hypothetical protein N7450_000016 [Penicillium hetheringtonii]|uniref:Kinesin light chain n=1 Tax=Penicillium hetheringtonii TaxID=911720 RepID=A0AAD6H029_9EURO|nr:hypothetical protein N7450_000016 [Penicillium hetheringtonii]